MPKGRGGARIARWLLVLAALGGCEHAGSEQGPTAVPPVLPAPSPPPPRLTPVQLQPDPPRVPPQVAPVARTPMAMPAQPITAPAPAPPATAQSTVSPWEDAGHAVAVDGAGNVFVAGLTKGVLDGASSLGAGDGFVSKWAADGSWLWTRQYGTSGSEAAHAIAIAADGDIVIAGGTGGQWGSERAGGLDAYVARLDPEGEVRWVQQYGSSGVDYATALAIAGDGAILAASIEQSNPNANAGMGALDCFEADGTRRWRDTWGGSPAAEPYGLAERAGAIYVVGRSKLAHDATFWGQNGPGAWSGVGFVRRYDASGQLAWEREIQAKGTEAHAVAIDPQLNAVVVGRTFGALTGDANLGAFDAFAIGLDGAGRSVWTRQLGTLGWDSATGVAILPDGDLVIAGDAVGDLDGDPETGYGGFVLRGDAHGQPRWIRQAFANTVFALATGGDQAAYATGWLFSASPPAAEQFEGDAYVARFESDGTPTLREVFGSSAP